MQLPIAFKERMERELGDSYGEFLKSYEKSRTFGLRYNPLKISKERLRSYFKSQKAKLEPVPWAEEGFYYPKEIKPGRMPLHEAGGYYIQEPSAMSAVALLDPMPGERVLDLCAAPGGKSAQIAGRMNGEGTLFANEIVSSRAKILSQNIERMGIGNAVVLNETPKRLAKRFPLYFDRIAVDAPCSGEGMFRKDERACLEWSLEQVGRCADRQKEILACAVEMLKPKGTLVYSTCTFSRQENEDIASWLSGQYPQMEMEKQMRIWPHLHRGEGHYAARFVKTKTGEVSLLKPPDHETERVDEKRSISASEDGSAQKVRNWNKKREQRQEQKQAMEQFHLFLQETLTQDAYAYFKGQMESGRLEAFGEQLCLLPVGVESLDGLKVERAGLQLGCCKKNRFEPAHAFAMALLPDQVKRTLELKEPERYLRGETLDCGGMADGWTLVTVQGCSLGWGKAVRGTLKNHYPKGLRWRF